MLKEFHAAGGSAHEYRQHAGGHGVQSAAVTDPPGLKYTPQLGYHILACPVLGLVYDYNSVHKNTFNNTPSLRGAQRRGNPFSFSKIDFPQDSKGMRIATTSLRTGLAMTWEALTLYNNRQFGDDSLYCLF